MRPKCNTVLFSFSRFSGFIFCISVSVFEFNFFSAAENLYFIVFDPPFRARNKKSATMSPSAESRASDEAGKIWCGSNFRVTQWLFSSAILVDIFLFIFILSLASPRPPILATSFLSSPARWDIILWCRSAPGRAASAKKTHYIPHSHPSERRRSADKKGTCEKKEWLRILSSS